MRFGETLLTVLLVYYFNHSKHEDNRPLPFNVGIAYQFHKLVGNVWIEVLRENTNDSYFGVVYLDSNHVHFWNLPLALLCQPETWPLTVDCSYGNNHMPICLSRARASRTRWRSNFVIACHWSWNLVKVGVWLEWYLDENVF